MFVELIEALRCPRDHEEAALIASSDRTEERHIIEGTLGCPVCQAEFRIVNGDALFDDPPAAPVADGPDAAVAMRLAAFLGLTDARGFALICGRWGAQADQLRRISDTPLLLVNPPASPVGDVAGVLRAATRLPLAESAARACALDDTMSDALVGSAVRATRTGGRVVGPVSLAVPAGLAELVRDGELWVAEKTAAPAEPAPRLVALKRG